VANVSGGIRVLRPASEFRAVLEEFPRLTSVELAMPAVKHDVQHILDTEGPPFRMRFRNLNKEKLDVAKAEFAKLVELGVCRRGSGQWASPLHMVAKSDKSWRPCGDYVRLNKLTKHDSYPLPRLQDFAQGLARARIFSKVDLIKAYHQVPMRPQDVEKTAIITPFGLFEYVRMPFGLKNSAQTFQRLMDTVVGGLERVFVYLDDILVASETVEQHVQDLRAVFGRLAAHGLLINPDKCIMGAKEVTFLGHVVSWRGIAPQPDRLSNLVHFPQPCTERELARFLGVTNYYNRFVRNCARLCEPLRDLLTNQKPTNVELSWTPEATEAFGRLQGALKSCVQLAFPEGGRPLRLCTDASSEAIGAVLEQEEYRGGWRPLGFYSKSLNTTERKYGAFDRELLAMQRAVLHFRPALEGTEFHILTDHKPLTGTAMISNSPTAQARKGRHWQFVLEFTTDVRHVAGDVNVVMDALSRLGKEDQVLQLTGL
jgi:hypothetical protein